MVPTLTIYLRGSAFFCYFQKPFTNDPLGKPNADSRCALVVRMGGLGGCVCGDQKGLLIFLIFKYINEGDVLIPNMVFKVIYGFYIRSYEHFKFQKLEI